MNIRIMTRCAFAALTLTLATPAANAQGQGKTLEIVVFGAAGDSYDTLSRLVGRHIGKHLPGNPAVIVRTMPGAGGIVVANHLYNVAARNGTVIGMLDQSIFETQLFSPETSQGRRAEDELDRPGHQQQCRAVFMACRASEAD